MRQRFAGSAAACASSCSTICVRACSRQTSTNPRSIRSIVTCWLTMAWSPAKRTPLKGQRLESLETAQAYLDRWETNWADKRIHGTTKRQVAAMFAEERPHLLRRFISLHDIIMVPYCQIVRGSGRFRSSQLRCETVIAYTRTLGCLNS